MIPTRIVLSEEVARIRAEGANGSFCLLPRHIDFVTTLVPGMINFETMDGREVFLAIDEGVLVKRGSDVLVSTANALGGSDLEQLSHTVREEFQRLNDRERQARQVLARLEADFARRFLESGEYRYGRGRR
jgi:F-type H+-transporting ATPase subunit epsilon